MIKIKFVRNVTLNNIDLHDELSRMHGSLPRREPCSPFQIRKIQRFDKSDTDISDLIIECFNRDESCQKLCLK